MSNINSIDVIKHSLHRKDEFRYLDAVQSSLPVKIDNSISTAYIDLKNNMISVNLEWYNQLPNTMKELVLVHEYFHYIYNHEERSERFKDQLSHYMMNICMDAEINSAIGLDDENGNYINNRNFMRVITHGINTDYLPVETSFEEYARIALKYSSNNNNQNNDDNSNNDQDSNNTSNSSQQQSDQLPIESFDDCKYENTSNSNDQQSIEDKMIRDITRKQIVDEIRNNTYCPGNIHQKLSEILDINISKKSHKMLWSTVLKRIISKNIFLSEGTGEYSTYTIMNDYYSGLDDEILFQGHYNLEKEIRIAVILDVSGSMDKLQDQILSVLCSISEIEENVIIDVYYVDTEILEVIYNLDNSCLSKKVNKRINGGGTDMEAGIEACFKTNHYDHIIVLTDGYTYWKERSNNQKQLVTVLLFGNDDIKKVPYTAYSVKS